MTDSELDDRTPLPTASWAPATKFVPPSQGDEVVLDDALVSKLSASIADHLVTLVVAQGGSGKTTLVAAATSRAGRPVGWLRLAPTDDDPILLVELLALAIDRAAPGSCPTALSLLSAGEVLLPHQLMGVLVNDLVESDPLIVVLDDLHHLQGAAALDALMALLDAAPEHVRVVATARHLPDIKLARLRANARLGEISSDDLAISESQAAEILDRRHVESARQHDLIELANGWVTGLLLASRLSANEVESAGTARALGDYLAEEVIAEESPEAREFLLSISVLDDLDPARCAAVSGVDAAGSLLEDLRARLGFLVIDHGGVLRLHDLLRERLRDDLDRESSPATLAALHRRAAEGARGADRVRHLLEAGEFGEAAAEIELLAQRWPRTPSAGQQLATWIDQLPDDVRTKHAWLDLNVAATATYRLDSTIAAPLLRSVIDRSTGDDGFERRCMAYRLLGLVTHDFDAYGEMVELEHDPRWADLPVTTRVEWMIGSAWPQVFMGRPEGAADRTRQAMAAVIAEPDLAAAETMALNAGPPLAVWPGAIDELNDHLAWLDDRFGARSVLVRIATRLAIAYLDALRGGDPPSPTFSPAEREIIEHFPFWAIADDLLRVFPALVSGDHRSIDSIAHHALAREGSAGRVALNLSPYVAAAARARGHRAVIDDMRTRLAGWSGGPPGGPAVMAARGIVEAELAWVDGDLDRAAQHLLDTDAQWSQTFLATQLDPICELALLRNEQGRRREALELLTSRLDHLVGHLGAPGRVAFCGPALAPLLSELSPTNRHARSVAAIVERGSPPAATPVPGTPDVLTSRELEVLDLLATGASNADIAEQLYLSINTVKTHVQRVLAKLQANSRTEAVARARDHRLI